MDPEDEVNTMKPAEMYEGLVTDRVISRNLRHLLKRGGSCFKVDYANAHRDELARCTHRRSLFVEGVWRKRSGSSERGLLPLMGNDFHKCQVILDVYHQTKDPSDKTGGYFTSEFKAV